MMTHSVNAGGSEPESDIEITPEMIKAGRNVISSCWLDFTGPTGDQLWVPVLREVFLAMMEARRK